MSALDPTRGGSSEETSGLPVDAVFEILADGWRRHLLYYLIEEAGGTAEVPELADHLCSVGAGPASADAERVLTELHHRHLPRMDDAGLVDYEHRRGSVRYLQDSLVEDCLARVAARDLGEEP